MKNKWLWGGVLVLVLAAVYAILYSVPTKQADTTEWQTYRNDTYGFELKYPKGWYLTESGPSIFIDINPIIIPSKDTEPPRSLFGIFITPAQDMSSRIETIKNTLKLENPKQSNILVGGLSATKLSGVARGESYIRDQYYEGIFLNQGNSTYALLYINEDDKYSDMFQVMIQSFNFN